MTQLTALDDILDECLQDIAAGQSSIEECLKRYPHAAGELAPLLHIAARTRAMPRPGALPADKRRAIEQQLLDRALQFAPVAPAAPPRTRRWQWAWVAGALMVGVCSGAGLITGSALSLPGEALYPVKRVAEQVSMALASSATQATAHVELAQRRLAEFDTLARQGDVRPELMADASAEAALALRVADQLPDAAQQAVYAAVVRVTDAQLATLAESAALVEPAARSVLETSAASAAVTRAQALDQIDQPPTPTSTPSPTATSTPTTTPIPATLTPTVPPPTETLEPKHTLPVVLPTDRPTLTPRPPNTPPGQVKTPKPTDVPADVRPKNTPPGQVDKTPKPKK